MKVTALQMHQLHEARRNIATVLLVARTFIMAPGSADFKTRRTLEEALNSIDIATNQCRVQGIKKEYGRIKP